MNTGKMVFSQLMEFLPIHEFNGCVERYGGHYKVQSFTCRRQLLTMIFAQLTYRESLRDIEACLRAMPQRLYHMGIGGPTAKSTLADANEARDWRIYADFAQVLIQEARVLYAGESLCVELEQTVYALDSSTIDLCLSLFPWATLRKRKAAVKVHTQLDLRGNIPTFIQISDGKLHDVNFLDDLTLEAGAIYVMDRGYIDFARLYTLNLAKAFFVTRAKKNMQWRRLRSFLADPASGVLSDQEIMLDGATTAEAYPERLRRIRFHQAEQDRTLIFLTNDFIRPASTIALLYKSRWQIELFFKWIKQNLRIKAFYGTSENAVKTQIWIAIAVYVLVAIAKKRLGIDMSLHAILQVINLSVFEKVPIHELFTNQPPLPIEGGSSNSLLPFDL
ncbi:MAG: IS4 family transposase [Acidobacteriota bacterium]